MESSLFLAFFRICMQGEQVNVSWLSWWQEETLQIQHSSCTALKIHVNFVKLNETLPGVEATVFFTDPHKTCFLPFQRGSAFSFHAGFISILTAYKKMMLTPELQTHDSFPSGAPFQQHLNFSSTGQDIWKFRGSNSVCRSPGRCRKTPPCTQALPQPHHIAAVVGAAAVSPLEAQ